MSTANLVYVVLSSNIKDGLIYAGEFTVDSIYATKELALKRGNQLQTIPTISEWYIDIMYVRTTL